MPTDTADRKKGHKARFLISLFAAQAKAKLSDAKLAKACVAEYPDSESPWEKRMGALRRIYNAGGLAGQESAPKIPVPRYDDNGEILLRGKPGPKPGSKPAAKAPAKATIKAPVKTVAKKVTIAKKA